MKFKDVTKLVISIAIPQLAGLIGSWFTFSSIPTWYASLIRPELAPPNWVFGPVWTTLFLLMGVAVFLVWRQGFEKMNIKVALIIFAVQLVLNVFWSVLFFGLQNPGASLVEIFFLWLAILVNLVVFYKISRTAAWLLVPYLLWVSFAAFLNYSFWVLN